jgi:hypothetical protein
MRIGDSILATARKIGLFFGSFLWASKEMNSEAFSYAKNTALKLLDAFLRDSKTKQAYSK